MKLLVIILILVSDMCIQRSYGQILNNKSHWTVSVDSLSSTFNRSQVKIDSIKQNLFSPSDSVKYLKKDFSDNADSLKDKAIGRIDSITYVLNNRLDSLEKIPSLTLGEYKKKSDNLYQKFDKQLSKIQASSGDSLTNRAKDRLNTLKIHIKKKSGLMDSVLIANKKASDLPVANSYAGKIPSLKLPAENASLKLPSVNTQYDQFNISSSDIAQLSKGIPNISTKGLDQTNQIGDLQSKVQDVTRAVKDSQGYVKDVNALTEGNVKDISTLPKTVEQQATKIEQVKDLQSEIGQGNALAKEVQTLQEKVKDPEALQAEAIENAKKQYVDYLAGHEEQVKTGADQLFKYQKKYNNLPDSRNLPTIERNRMKSKPWQERIVPGIFFQINHQFPQWTGVDLSPFIGYKFTGRIRSYIGGSYRVYVNTRDIDYNNKAHAYSFRWFTHLRAFGGFYGHIEVERNKEIIKGKVPSALANDPHLGKWSTRWYAGVANIRKINKNLNSTIIVLYNLNKVLPAFTFDKVVFRFGLEYRLKKKKENKKVIE